MKQLQKFFIRLGLILGLMAAFAIIVDGGFDSFLPRPVFMISGFMAIVVAGQVFIFEKVKKSFWISFAFSAMGVFATVFLFALAYSFLIFDGTTIWIATSQGLMSVIFLLALIMVITLTARSELVLRPEPPIVYIKVSLTAALVTFSVTSAMSSDQFLLHGQTFDVFLGMIMPLAIFATFNAFFIGSLLYIFSLNSRWNSRPWALALLVTTIMTIIDAIVFDRYLGPGFPKVVGLYLIVCGFITLLILAMLIYRQKSHRLSQMSFAFAQKEAEYISLKQQIDPHFLFNNLNTMIAFIETQPAKAIQFGYHLSDVYRHFLKTQPEEFVPLKDELEFLADYLEIYRAKFREGFLYDIQMCDTSGKYVLSLAVRELADNFFKHNDLDSANPPILNVYCMDDHLVFENTLNPERRISNGNCTGIQNISRRYRILTNLDVIVVTDERFIVKLPLLQL